MTLGAATDLALWHVVPAKGTHDEARVARVRRAAVAGIPRAGDETLALHAVLRHLGRRRGWKCEKGCAYGRWSMKELDALSAWHYRSCLMECIDP